MLTYEPLNPNVDSLRVLVLLPRHPSAGDTIACELQNRTFNSKPAFEALSYTWGTQPPSKTIKINREPFLVRENLYDALRHLRIKKPRALWVDAICINQDDVPERNAQVSLMAFIYTRAQRVLAWLGPSPRPVQHDYFSDDHWHAMSHNPYWSRLWIIQELVLPNEVLFYLGRYSFGWDKVSSTMNPEWRVLQGRSDVIEKMREERYTSTQSLELLIELFQKAECSEKRDKIYGFLGLTHDGSDKAIKVDYKIAYPQLYAQLLEFHQQTPAPFDSPFTNNIDRSAKLIKFSQLVQKVLGGSVAEEVQIMTNMNWSKIFYTVRGLIAGEILWLGPTHTQAISSVRADRSWKQAITQTYQSVQDLQYMRKANETFFKAILSWEQKHLERIKGVTCKASYGYQCNADEELRNIGLNEEDTPDASEPRLFFGTRNMLGMAPPEAKVGDVVCAFLGCDVSVVVRKIEHGAQGQFMIVGRANIYREQYFGPDAEGEVQDAIEYDLSRLLIDEQEGVTNDPSFQNLINLRLDLETLQKLTT